MEAQGLVVKDLSTTHKGIIRGFLYVEGVASYERLREVAIQCGALAGYDFSHAKFEHSLVGRYGGAIIDARQVLVRWQQPAEAA